jgi:hypothetical protein
MDSVTSATVAASMADTKVGQAVTMNVLKKALDAQESVATGLINALPPVQNLPDHLGQNINTTA